MISVVVAAADIPQATVIKPDMLTTIKIPQDQAMEVMIFDADEIVGTIARYKLDKGIIILRSMVTFLP